MSWEPDSEEIRLRKQNDEIEKLKQSQFYLGTGINTGSLSNNIGTRSGSSGWQFPTTGDIQQTLTNAFTGSLGIAGIILGALIKLIPATSGEPTVDCATVHIVNGGGLNNEGIVGQKVSLKPEAGKTICLIDNPTTNASTAGNLILGGSDIVVQQHQIVTLRFQKDITFSDGVGGWIVDSTGGTGGGGGTSSTNNNAIKTPCRVATTTNGTLATDFENGDTIDGVVLATNDRILIKDQTAGQNNGIYVVQASGAPVRATDFDADSEVIASVLVLVAEGSTNADTIWQLTTDDPITVGTTSLSFTQFTGGGTDNLGNHTATQALKMKDFAIFLDTAELHSIISLSGAINYVNDTAVGGAHDFYVDDLVIPKFGITETSIESNVNLDMNGNEILSSVNPATSQFQIVFDGHDDSDTYITNSTTADRINIFSNGINTFAWQPTINATYVNFDMQANELIMDADQDTKIQAGTDDVLQFTIGGSVRVSMTNTEILSVLPINQFGDIDMNSFDIHSIDRLVLVKDSGAMSPNTNYGLFVSSSDDLLLNADENNTIGFSFNNNVALSLVKEVGVSTDHSALNIWSDITNQNSVSFVNLNKQHTTPVINQPIGQYTWYGTRTGNPALVSYGYMQVEYENIGVGTHSGSMRFDVFENSSDITYMHLNDGDNNLIEMFRDVDMNTQDIINVDRVVLVKDSGAISPNTDYGLLVNSDDNLLLNANETRGIGFSFNNNVALMLEKQIGDDHNALTVWSDITNQNSASLMTLNKQHTVPVLNQTIGEYQWWGTRTGNPALVSYGAVGVDYENIGVGTHSGSMRLEVMENALAVTYIHLNDGDNNIIDVFKTIDMNTHDLNNVGTISFDITGTDIIVDGIGMLLTVPASDVFDFSISGSSRMEISNIKMDIDTNYIEMDARTAPTHTTATKRYVFVDSADNHLKVRTNSGLVDLEAGGGSSSFTDSAFDVHDDTTPSKVFKFNADNLATSTTNTITAITTSARTWTLPDITGELLSLNGTQTVQGAKTFNANLTMSNLRDILPATDLGSSLGDSTHSFSNGYFNKVLFDYTTKFIQSSGASDLIFEVPSGGQMFMREAGTTFWTLDGVNNINLFSRDVHLTAGEAIRADSATEIGYFVTNSTAGVGTRGTMQIPVEPSLTPTIANLNSAFGAVDGAIGLYNTSSANVVLAIRARSDEWVLIAIPDSGGTVTGDHINT